MKKNINKGILILIVLLIICVISLLGYIISNKVKLNENLNEIKDNINDSNLVEDEDNVVDSEIDKNEDSNEEVSYESKLLQSDSFNYVLNNKTHKIIYNYFYRDSKYYYRYDDEETLEIYKQNNDYVYSEVYIKIYFDDQEIEDIELPIYYDTENIDIDKLMDKVDLLSSETINIIKGVDKEYLVFTIEHDAHYIDSTIDPFIVNENGKVIYKFNFLDGQSLCADDKNSMFYCLNQNTSHFIIKENNFYFITLYKNDSNGTYVQENSITINNDQVKINEGNIYIGIGAGAI